MSYEGYKQIITNKGNYFTVDQYEDDPKFKDPKERIIWINYVDVTNGSFDNGERIDGYLDPVEIASAPRCSHCNQTTGEAKYKPPLNGGIHIVCDEIQSIDSGHFPIKIRILETGKIKIANRIEDIPIGIEFSILETKKSS